MMPYIHLGPLTIGSFGVFLWFAAVTGAFVLHKNFQRSGINADAVSIVAVATAFGILGAKLWHLLDTPGEWHEAVIAVRYGVVYVLRGQVSLGIEYLSRLTGGFAWFGGLLGGLLALLWQARSYKIPFLRLLDLASPAAAIGYAVGRIGCLVAGDGDYGKPTSLPWGMSFPNGTVPVDHPVQPTPLYECLAAIAIGWWLWKRSEPWRALPVAEVLGEYFLLSGLVRFFIEFIRINPPVFLGLSNAQLASIGCVVVGLILIAGRKRSSVPAETQA